MVPLQTALDPAQLGIEVGGGAVIGAIVGYAAKKLARVIAVLIGVQLALFVFLESRQIITVDWERLSGGLIGASMGVSPTPPSWLLSIISTMSVSAGFVGGFLLGFRRG
jgi:uncharacterized membrane protein (Fun14 family)